MRYFFAAIISLVTLFQQGLYSQTPNTPKLYSHKVVVEEILHTSKYTYLHVKEQIKGKDSLQWLALPSFEPSVGDTYYFDSGLQMGEFRSKELDRTFTNILFLGGLSTSLEVSAKNIVPAPPAASGEAIQNQPVPVVHTVVVKEVLQTRGYTYLQIKEGEKENWAAVTKIQASVGQTYTYDDAALMTNFKSQELNRTFDEVLFIASLKLVTDSEKKNTSSSPSGNSASVKKNPVKIKPSIGIITIASLQEKKTSYKGKTVTIKGEVTKFSHDILGKNWIHLTDNTAFSGKSDLVITTEESTKVGDTITVEGVISLDKDYGSGYFYDILMEEARLLVK